MGQQIMQVDAFTDRPFAGNPAAVCVLPTQRDDQWQQRVAAEMNLSETAFLLPYEDGYGLRWFTPTVEVDLCGHATLASAHALWELGLLESNEEARFYTRSGVLTARRAGELIELDFPAISAEKASPPDGLLEALQVQAIWTGKTRLDYLVEVSSEAVLRAIQPDHAKLRLLGLRGVIVTSPADSGSFDFVSRFFAPGSGIDEDPVTGSAHCCLGPYWGQQLGKSVLVGFQASQRGGVVRVRLAGDRVILGGQAVTVLRGELSAAAN